MTLLQDKVMKTSFDVKSLVIGLVVGLVLAALLGATSKPEAGRFQFATNPGHAFVFDTQTGQVWEKFEGSSGGDTTSGFNDPKTTPATP
jgi:hypothetical protein